MTYQPKPESRLLKLLDGILNELKNIAKIMDQILQQLKK